MPQQLYPVVYNAAEGNLCFTTESRPYLRRLQDGTEASADAPADVALNGVAIASGITPMQEQQGLVLAAVSEQLKDLARTVEHLNARVASLEAAPRPAAKAAEAKGQGLESQEPPVQGPKRASKEG